jgi:release factor glutamine methyltransferase
MHTDSEPLAYLIGNIPFLDTTIFLDSHPLIPRPETEYWVEQAITDIRACALAHARISILDLCAGSGCIGVAVLKALEKTMQDARVDFAEINAGHHSTIAKNILRNGIDPSRTRIYGGDIFSEIAKVGTQYDFILANPPYIDPKRIDRVQKSVIDYEPAEALFGGTDGMEYISRIIKEAPNYLASPGVLYIEHEPEQTKAIHTLAQSSLLALPYTSCKTYPDQYKTERYTRLTIRSSP